MSAPGTPMLSAYVNAIKGHTLSADKKEVSVLLEAKHVGELSIVLSTDQLELLAAIIDKVKSELPGSGGRKSASVAVKPASVVVKPASVAAKPESGADKNEIKVVVPKDWTVAADLKLHDLVLLIFNRQSAARTAYALDPAAAKGMAEGLVKNADMVLQKKQGQAPKENSGARH